ncbi:MAG: amidase [Casimicrobiaceae bacterium]
MISAGDSTRAGPATPDANARGAADAPVGFADDILDRDALGAFCRHTHVALAGAPDGPLTGTTFGVKDLYDIAGHRSGFGNPTWLATHPVAPRTAVAVTRLLDAGARMVGKTHTDELAYSLNGENRHYGTPINPSAPGRLPGGSSSGSAAAVAGRLVDFALGSDTGGSVRVPAGHCGVLGMRVSHGAIPLAGAIPFAPSFDTAGWFARDAALFEAVGRALLADQAPARSPRRFLLAADAFHRADASAASALSAAMARTDAVLGDAEPIHLADAGLDAWMNDFRVLQAHEIWATHRDWVRTERPEFGGGIAERFAWAATVTDAAAAAAAQARMRIRERMDALLADDAVIALPTTVGAPPLLGTPAAELDVWRNRCLGLLCIAGHAGLPQISLPLATVDGAPVGLSLLAARGNDTLLLQLARRLHAS